MSDLKVGEYVIDFESIYEITAVTGNDNDKMIHYKPVVGTQKIFTASIPAKSMEKSGMRRLISSKQIDEVVKCLKADIGEYVYSSQFTVEQFYLNTPEKTIPHLKHLWKSGDTLPRTEAELREKMIYHICLEISFVSNEPLTKVRSKVEKHLGKQVNKPIVTK